MQLIDPVSTWNTKSSPELAQSRAWLERSKRVIPGCAQTFSKSPMQFVQGAAPNFLERADGPYAWDVDGNRYIDYILGLGPVLLGHRHPDVQQAVLGQMENGVSFSLPHPLEVEVAERLCEWVPCAEMVRFGKNGSDATSAAVRVARAFTGRDYVVRCGYHGWQDWYIGSTPRHLGVPEDVRRLTLTFPYNDPDALRQLFRRHPDAIACVIMEPVTFEPPADGYLATVKELCRQNGALLVFDEIVTGFRFAPGGAQEFFQVTPDLACLGKGMANGFPLSAVVGRADVMDWFNRVFFSFTYGGETLSLAACLVVMKVMEREDVIGHFWRIGERLKQETNRLAGQQGLTAHVQCVGFPPWTTLRFRDDDGQDSLLLRSLFQQEAIRRGILTHGNHMLSYRHTDAVIDETLNVYGEIFPVLAEAIRHQDIESRLAGPPIQPVMREG